MLSVRYLPAQILDVAQPATMPLADVSDRNGLVRFNIADDILMEPVQQAQFDVIHLLWVGNY